MIKKIVVTIFVMILFGGLLQPSNFASSEPTQAEMEQELKDIERQISEYTNVLAKTQSEKKTLANKIAELQARSRKIALQIKETGLKLNSLQGKITTTNNKIAASEARSARLTKSIAVILRQMNAVEENMLIALLSSTSWSDVYNQIQDASALASALNDLAQENKKSKSALVDAKAVLEDQKTDAANLLKIQSIQKQDLAGTIGEQNSLLVETKGKENNYQTLLADRKKRAAELRGRIYELFNTGKQINFGQAVDIAKWTSNLTGVRAAFVLAVLTQESNLGKNVGTCNRAGDPESKSWKVVMKPTRDHEPFKTITGELGLDIDTTPVSCPMKDKNGNQVGWGGAMGPAQFIPSTWMGYRAKVAKLSGKSTANPWDIRDSFLAAAIKLTNDGADGTDDGDWQAAMKYFAGSVNLKYRFYGDNVLKTTKQYEEDMKEM